MLFMGEEVWRGISKFAASLSLPYWVHVVRIANKLPGTATMLVTLCMWHNKRCDVHMEFADTHPRRTPVRVGQQNFARIAARCIRETVVERLSSFLLPRLTYALTLALTSAAGERGPKVVEGAGCRKPISI